MKPVSDLVWNFNQVLGNAVFVENSSGEHSSETRYEQESDVIHVEPDEDSQGKDDKGVPEGTANTVQDEALLKESGTQKFKIHDYEGALKDFDAADNIEPRCPLTLKYRAEIKRILHQYPEAMADLNLADEIQPNNLFTLSTRGTVYKELKEYENALQDLNRANEIDDRNSFVKTQRGVVNRSLKRFDEALTDLNEANALRPNQAFILAQLGTVKRELKEFAEALIDLDTAHKLDPSDAFVFQQRAVVRRELGNLEGALKDLNEANKLTPKDPYTLRRRGVSRRELLDYQGSLEDLNTANNLEPCNDFTLSERGVTKKVLGDFQGALQDLTMADYIKPDQAFTLKHRGSAYRKLGMILEALHDLSCAHTLEPDDFFTLLELAKTKKLSDDLQGSLELYNKVVEMKPNDPSILRQRGSLKRKLCDFDGALDDLVKADESQPALDNTIATMIERCFTKYAMNDAAGALEDAKIVRNLWGPHGQSSIKGEKLKLATTQSASGPSEHASSMSQRLNDIEKSTAHHHILWINHNKLLFSKSLGRGSFGYVHKCKWVDKSIDVAVKYVPYLVKDAFEYEVRMLANIIHPRVVRFIGCSYDNEGKEGMIVMELMQQNLRSLIDGKKRESDQPFDFSVAADIMYKIAEAMAYIHDQGVLHRDLKCSNVLVNKGGDGKEEYVVKIADFGLARLQGKNIMPYFMTAEVGATPWRAPEVFKNPSGYWHKYSFPADIWSYGMTCYEILTGDVPFEGVACAQIHQKVLSGVRPELPASCPSILKVLLTKCWSLMPYDRPSFSDIHKTLKLYLGRDSSKDLKAGDVIEPTELRRLN